MRHWKRIALLGCGGVLCLCAVLPVVPYFWRVGQAQAARQRWAAHGLQDYTLVVGRFCFCSNIGDYRITVHQGQVTAVESAPGSTFPAPATLKPADFQSLTVEAVLSEAEAAARRSVTVPWLSSFTAAYDSQTGYVTQYQTSPNGSLSLFTGLVMDGDYAYTARDLQPLAP